MATKTISLELDAYEKLKRAKRTSSESFSSVVRRAVFPDEATTAAALLDSMRARMKRGSIPIPLEALDVVQKEARISL